ncbi:MAG: bifunctional 4-hydroxy-2-oxoglutarate aldolase/2-dehydro-3-deoxy-phosphogluconate aldolase [Candidatus Omnitrophica bacterium]|nr:bifunctional 4-hydroxy-2-oxoglutarate aldolase/2-dehydro-3-deoxy-phosphogluconate aldolase [Candidatus Omnitrophota bacterium]
MDIGEFKQLPILGILRGVEQEALEPLVEAMVSSGLKAVEITMNTEDAAGLIKDMVGHAEGRLTVGAGTVLTEDELNQALDAGATFIVSPTLVDGVAKGCSERNIPFFPGALTPQEIYRAHQAGAAMVKVFPVKFFGPDYLKEIKGPFKDIELLACGGVSPKTIKEYFDSGASAVAFGGSIFKKELLKEKKFIEIEKQIKQLIQARD